MSNARYELLLSDGSDHSKPPLRRNEIVKERLRGGGLVAVLGVLLLAAFNWASSTSSTKAVSNQYKDHVAQSLWPNQKWGYMPDSVYSDFSPRNQDFVKLDGDCRGWTPGSHTYTGSCWRAPRYDQLDAFLSSKVPNAMPWGARPEHDDVAALNHLKDCLADVQGELNCSPNVYKVLMSAYHWLNMGMKEKPFPSGETVWTSSYVKTMKKLGFTLLSITSLHDMVVMHNAMPDVITMIWASDDMTMTCQNDPRCVKDMRPTLEMYPDLGLKDGEPLWGWQSENRRPGAKWIWTQEELDQIPESERGTIPVHKLFAATVWGSRPGNGYFRTPDNSELTYNNLGHHWTVSSFQYPNHTYMPFSVEYTCLQAPLVPQSEKKDRIFVLGKFTEFFYETTAPEPEAWPTISQETKMKVICAGSDRPNAPHHELPEGVENTGHLNPIEFAATIGESRVMVAIGRPEISPSPYEALCQGTPVLMPYYSNLTADPWNVFSAKYSQHGPAIQLGEPYVYAYRGGDTEDLIRQATKAISTPIDRYIPPQMKIESLAERILWYMYFDWEGFATAIDDAKRRRYPVVQAYVMGRCFDMMRCRPFDS